MCPARIKGKTVKIPDFCHKAMVTISVFHCTKAAPKVPGGLLDESLLPLDVGEVVERVGVRGGELERHVVAVLRLGDEALLLERVRQVAVRVGEVGLQLDGAPVRVDRQVDQPEEGC